MHTTDGTEPFQDCMTREASTRWQGTLAARLEEHSAKLSTDTFLVAATAAIGMAITLQLSGRTSESLFLALWAAPYLLLLGVCNTLFKVGNFEREDRAKVRAMFDEPTSY